MRFRVRIGFRDSQSEWIIYNRVVRWGSRTSFCSLIRRLNLRRKSQDAMQAKTEPEKQDSQMPLLIINLAPKMFKSLLNNYFFNWNWACLVASYAEFV